MSRDGVRIVLLADQAGREKFDCGVRELNDFLRQQAGQQQRKGLGKTYLALGEADAILGFVTVSVGQVVAASLPPTLKLPRYPVPILRIGRLAVSRQAQGHGVGRALLAFAFRLAVDFSARVGLYAVVVDAKDASTSAYYRQLGFQASLDDPCCLYLPLSVLRQALP